MHLYHIGRDVLLHKHMVKHLPKGEELEPLHQLARDNKVRLEERREDDERALDFVTSAQERTMAQQRKDAVETCKENPEEEAIIRMQEHIPDTQG